MKAAEVKKPPERPVMLDIQISVDEPVNDIERYINLAYNPSVHAYHVLRSQIEQASPKWLGQFLEAGGFDAFMDALGQLRGHKFTNFSDAVLQLDCIDCVRAVLNTSVGMQYCLQQEECVLQLVKALDTPNMLPKKQLLEILTAIALFCRQGHKVVLSALQEYKKCSNGEHRFSVIVNELKNSETSTYRVTLMSLINVLLRGHTEVKDRSRVRQQFVTLRLLDVLSFMRKDDKEAELAIQLEIFDRDKHHDDKLMLCDHGIELSSHHDLLDALYNKMLCTPSSGHLLDILQDLLRLETSSCVHSESMWSAIAQTVHYITSLDNEEDCSKFVDRITRLTKEGQLYREHSSVGSQNSTYIADDRHLDSQYISDSVQVNQLLVPDRRRSAQSSTSSVQSSVVSSSTSPYDKDSRNEVFRQDSGISVSPYDNVSSDYVFRRLSVGRSSFGRREITVKPEKPVATVNWQVLKPADALKPMSLWKTLGDRSYKCGASLNYKTLEEAFTVNNSTDGNADYSSEVRLLEREDALRLNLLIARLNAMPEELADTILRADSSDLTAHSTKLLLEAMPSKQQIMRIKKYEGPRFTLAPAEQFLGFLTDCEEYEVMLEGLSFKANFTTNFPKLKAAFEALLCSCRDVLHHQGLKDFMKIILDAGNFLNAGSEMEPAAGIKISSLQKIADVKGHDSHSDLLTFLVKEVEKQDENILLFVNDFPLLEKASGFSAEDLKKEVTALNTQMKTFLIQLGQSPRKVKDVFQDFIEEVKSDLAGLHSNIARLKSLSSQLALFVCDEEMTFDLQACLKSLHEFVSMVKRIRAESGVYSQQQAAAEKRQAELREKMEDAQIMNYFGKKADLCSSFAQAQKDPLVDHILKQIHQGTIEYHYDDEVKTPESNSEFHLSNITRLISTPIDDLDIDLESDSFIFQAAGQGERRTYVDRVEAVINDKYHREKQMESASFVAEDHPPGTSGDKKPTPDKPLVHKRVQATKHDSIAHQTSVQFKIYPKIATPELLSNSSQGKKRHMRSKSDMDRSRITGEKWRAYAEKFTETAEDLEKAMESSNAVMSLGLEKQGHVLRARDIQQVVHREERQKNVTFHQVPVPDENLPHEKKKKIGFFQRLSQAVLKQRNSNVMEDAKNQDGKAAEILRGSKRWSGRGRKGHRKSVDKENLRGEGKMASLL